MWLGSLTVVHAAQTATKLDPFPRVAAAYIVEIDGAVVWQREPRHRLAPASLSKLMTLLLAAESGRAAEDVTVTPAAAAESGKRIGLRQGERWRMAELMAGSMLASGNDACRAIADHLGGDQARFVARMNQRAIDLGLHDTHYANACGHDDPQQYTSATDLLRLAHEVMKHPPLRGLARLQTLSIGPVSGTQGAGPSGRPIRLVNTNALLGRQADVVGLKTGTTPRAGACLVVVAQRDGHEVVLVMLKGSDRWWDAADILDIAFGRATSGS